MQHITTTVHTVERLHYSINLVQRRLDINSRLLHAGDCKKNKGEDSTLEFNEAYLRRAINECKAAIKKLRFLLDNSHNISNIETEFLLKNYHQYSFQELKHTIQLYKSCGLSTTQITTT